MAGAEDAALAAAAAFDDVSNVHSSDRERVLQEVCWNGARGHYSAYCSGSPLMVDAVEAATNAEAPPQAAVAAGSGFAMKTRGKARGSTTPGL
jgi:hypothetical protein